MNELITKSVLSFCLCVCNIAFCIVSARISSSVWFIALFSIFAAVSVYIAVVSWQAAIRAAKAKDNLEKLTDITLHILMQKDMERTAKELGVSEEWLWNLRNKS